jgi:cell division protein FtsI/penicillin-binding protein 2/cell division protein FtsW (lipid II flippase)
MTPISETDLPYSAGRMRRERWELRASRREEFLWMVLASFIIIVALLMVSLAKSAELQESSARLAQRPVLDLNRISSQAQLLPYVADLPDSDRPYVAERIYDALHSHKAQNVGAIARLRVKQSDLRRRPGLAALSERIRAEVEHREKARSERLARMSWLGRRFIALREWLMPPPERDPSIPLLTQQQFRNLKPWFTVRTVNEFRIQLLLWALAYFVALYGLHLFWRARSFAGDNLILPMVHLLTGVGLVLMVSLRDPIRDTLAFSDFALGAVLGAVAMGVFSVVDYERTTKRYSYVFLLGAITLGLLLASPLGTGPGTSDAKVTLFGFQPVEVIRLLIVFFLAGYFAEHWDVLRDLRQKTGVPLALAERFHVPRLDYVIPVAAGVAASLLLFFFLKDLGPALVIGSLFLILYSIARHRVLAALCGLLIIVLGCAAGHAIGYPETVEQRVEIWRAPWRNAVRGGDQVAHSMWALSSGGWQGSGIGMGSPSYMPAAHTDLILSAAGEELGFVGLACVFLLYGLLTWRTLRIALNARTSYSYFLAMGLALIVILQLLLIAGGLLGIIPLSGVVSPFLSYGKSSMIATCAAFGIVMAISASSPDAGAAESIPQKHFGRGTHLLGASLAVCLVVISARAAYIQVVKADGYAIRDAETRYADGGIGLEYNPRLGEIIRHLPKGDIFDRNGLPLATSNMSLVKQHREDYAKLGTDIAQTVTNGEPRHYPLGPELFYLVGDVRTTLKAGAHNTLFQENLSRVRLQGYDDRREGLELKDPDTGVVSTVWRHDYTELLPLLRHRHDPGNEGVRELLDRARDVHMSIDARLQMRASDILARHLRSLGKKGALVVLDPESGDVLAAVSYPWPEQIQFDQFRLNPDRSMERELLDRARFGLYPPGSSFKIVTATAALRENPDLAHVTFECRRLPDGRVGNYVGRSKRPIRDDELDQTPHGTVDMAKGITVSCNAYFAQLGASRIGAKGLLETARMFGIDVAHPNTSEKLDQALAQASYGQGQVLASPFQMARVAASIAAGGSIPQGRWVIDESNSRNNQPVPVLPPTLAAQLAGYMRAVVTSPSGTGRVLSGNPIPIAGKTGTAELAHAPSHAWFIGFAPYGPGARRRIAFAVLVENGQYGGRTAAPIAGELVTAAHELGLL